MTHQPNIAAMTIKDLDRFLAPTAPLNTDPHPDDPLTTIIGLDTFDVAMARIHRLLAHRRNVTYQRCTDTGETQVHPVAIPSRHLVGAAPGTNWYDYSDVGSGCGLVWVAAYTPQPEVGGDVQIDFDADDVLTAAEAAAEARSMHRSIGRPANAVRVTIQGGGPGHDGIEDGDHIIVESYDGWGIYTWTRIDFEPTIR